MTDWPNHQQPWREWRNALAGQRMHHGWILAGKSGLGKRDFALSAARELVAQDGVPQPAGEHPDILTVTYGPKDKKAESARDSGKSFDLSNVIKIDQIRDMERRLHTRPTLGARRAIIVVPAEDMNKNAANALLKSLEEPPAGTFFLLVAHRPSRLLPTIRSRCRILRFPLLEANDLAQMLAGEGYAPDTAALHAAGGSFGSAVRFVEQDLGPIARVIDGLLTAGDPGFVGRSELSRLIGPRADRARMQAVMELAQGITADRARKAQDRALQSALIEAHGRLVTLTAEAPTANFDNGLLSLEIGTLLVSASAASDPAHG